MARLISLSCLPWWLPGLSVAPSLRICSPSMAATNSIGYGAAVRRYSKEQSSVACGQFAGA